ncbi:MAG: molybdopterin-dependent oxidoreductase [Gammaproteobacteria bacterium]
MNLTRHSFCRICTNHCAITVEVQDGRVLRVAGDADSPLYGGYSCIKGRAQPHYLAHPDRLLKPLKRTAAGGFEPIALDQALDEIAARLIEIRDRHGPRAIALYGGTMMVATAPTVWPLHAAFCDAVGTPMRFDPNTMDKGGKQIAAALHGRWMAPSQGFDDPQVALLIGINPIDTYTGLPAGNPGQWLKDRARRGMKLIVIDPRASPAARRADLHLQPAPGHDAEILAGMIRVVLAESLQDRDFLAAHVAGVDALRAAVEPFTPEEVARRADVPADDVVRAARLFAGARRGYAMAGTGPSFSGPGSLVEYLVLALETICGHWLRAGERVRAAPVLVPAPRYKAQAEPPKADWGLADTMRVRGLRHTHAGLPAGAFADEMLLPGEGRIRALISVSGNPAAVLPDQLKTAQALASLDLLVQVDPWMSRTAELAHYVLPPPMPLEVPAATHFLDIISQRATGYGLGESYAQYSPAIAAPPPGSELIEEWKLFAELGRRMGLAMTVRGFDGTTIDAPPDLDTEVLLERLSGAARVPLDVVRQYPSGALFPEPAVTVAPPDPEWTGRLDVGNGEMMRDLARLAAEGPARAAGDEGFAFRYVSRRHRHVYNTSCNIPQTHRGKPYNPASMHPADMQALGLAAGDVAEIRSARGAIRAVVEPDTTLRRGLVAMMYGFGAGPERDGQVREIGSNPNRLLSVDTVYDRYTGQPRMSNVPVNVSKLQG